MQKHSSGSTTTSRPIATMRSSSSSSVLFFAALLAASLLPSSSDARGLSAGRWESKDPHGHYVVEIGKFAIAANNEITKHTYPLVFVAVVKAEAQAMADGATRYRLDVETKHKGVGASEFYRAVVIDKPSKKFRMLYDFLKISN